ncbi:MAG: phage tail protein [Litorimonas sp.]
MTEPVQSFMTDVGRAADVNSYIAGQRLELTEFVLGSSARVIDGTEEIIANEVWRGPINRIAPTELLGQFVVEVVVPSEAGPFEVREGGALDSAGRLIAISKYAPFTKIVPEPGGINEAYLSMTVTLDHPENLVLKIDPTVVTASRAHVEDVVSVRDARLATLAYISARNALRAHPLFMET